MDAPSTASRAVTRLPKPAPLDEFLGAFRAAVDERSLMLVLSKNRHPSDDLKGVRIRLIDLRGSAALSFVYRYSTRDVTKNLDPAAASAAIESMLGETGASSFAHAVLQTHDRSHHLMVSRRGKQTLRSVATASTGGESTEPEARAAIDHALAPHDRAKARALSLELPFLVDLGITDAAHRLVPSMARKWKQIDKFLEVLDGALDAAQLPLDRPLRLVDFGCGKGYLTFAAYAHLQQRFGVAPQVVGVELRRDLVDLCNRAAERSHCEGLRFVQGDLRSFEPDKVDVMIALHACDTATDHAIDLGLRADARVLVCSPCCHKELRPQMSRPAPLGALFRHGIHLGQEAEMVTDTLRALLLEAAGYDAKVFEFVALEHTHKNKMILATRSEGAGGDRARARAEVDDLMAFYGIREQCLERLLRERALARPASTGRE